MHWVYRYRRKGALSPTKIAHQKFTVFRACADGSTSLQSDPSMEPVSDRMAEIQRMTLQGFIAFVSLFLSISPE